MKRLLITLSVICCCLTALYASCYSAWYESYTAATAQYQSNTSNCSNAWNPSYCQLEAEAIYGQSIEEASQAYYHCVM